MTSYFIKTLSAALVMTGISALCATSAYASCGTLYCSSGSSLTLGPALSSQTVSHTASQSGSYYTSQSASHKSMSPHVVPFSGPLQGLGANESLRPTTCPVSVYNPTGAEVLGCYSVVKTQPTVTVQNYIRVVRPIIYVRYPVAVQIPTCGGTWSRPAPAFQSYGPGPFMGAYGGGCGR